jgi:predicted alpha/beta superfamily hydrolase
MLRNDESPLPNTEVHHLRSEHVGDEFKVLLAHSGEAVAGPRPVLVLADPWAAFGTAAEMVRVLRLSGSVPDTVVVGVGYRSAAMDDIVRLRTRDLTPTVDRSRLSDSQPEAMMAGADAFLAFLRDELAPWLDGRHGADPADATFLGYSLGGLFATHVLLTDPTAFRRYAIGSPSLWWDDGVTFATAEAHAAANDDLAARVHCSVGELETLAGRRRFIEQLAPQARAAAEAEDAADGPVDMVADMQRMVALLNGRGYPSLELESEVLAGEYHETAPPVAMSRALRRLHGAPR